MKAGILKEKISILKSDIVTSEFGENTTTWYPIYSTRANIKFKSQNRSNDNDEIFYSTSIEFKVRSYVPVTEWNRILWNKKQYRIISLLPNKENQEVLIITELVNE